MADETIRTDRYWDDENKVWIDKPIDRTYDRDLNKTEDCSSSDAGPAAAMGGVGGAVTGAIAGSATGPAGAVLGAVIGGVAGAVASGAAVGAVDRVDDDDAIKGEVCDTVDSYGTRTFEPADPTLRKSWDRDASELYTPGTSGATDFSTTGSRFEDWDSDFRSNWQSNYYGGNYTYEDYEPAYRYGYSMYSESLYADRDWPEFENDAKTGWETRQPGTWDRFKNAIRYGWERAKAAFGGSSHDDAGRRVA